MSRQRIEFFFQKNGLAYHFPFTKCSALLLKLHQVEVSQ
jgi:hypothetical protein